MRKVIFIFAVILACLAVSSCASEKVVIESEITELEAYKNKLEAEIACLEAEKDSLANEIIDTKIDNGTAKYVLTFNIKQTHYSLDITEHLKDSVNDVSIQVPVDKEYYDSVKIGDVIDDSFRVGSFIFKGSFGSWRITIENKTIV